MKTFSSRIFRPFFLSALLIVASFAILNFSPSIIHAADLYCEQVEGDLCCNSDTSSEPYTAGMNHPSWGSWDNGFVGDICANPGVQCEIPSQSMTCFDMGGGGGGGSGDLESPASILVGIFGVSPSQVSWTINPGNYNYTGNQGIVVFPSSGGTNYTISASSVSGCARTVMNSKGGGSSMAVYQGEDEQFGLFYDCEGTPIVDIKANDSNGPIGITAGTSATLSWVSDNVTSCTASGSWSGSKTASGTQSTGNLSAGTYTYTITCSGSGGSASDSVIVNVSASGGAPSTPTIATLTGSSCQTVRITWGGYPSYSEADSFEIYRNGSLVGTSPGNRFWYEDQGLTVGQSYSYQVRAVKGGVYSAYSNTSSSQPSGSCAVPPDVSLSADPTTINSGQSSQLVWEVYNATSCAASATPAKAGWSGSKAATNGQHNQYITDITQTTLFTVTCSNAYGTSNDSATVTVGTGPLPTITLDADPLTVTSGGSTELRWTPGNATSCTASASPANGQWTGSKSTVGGINTVNNLTQTTTFTITCSNANGSKNDSKTVTVGPPTGTLGVTISADPEDVSDGLNSVLTWTTTGSPTSCQAFPAPGNPTNPQWTGPKSASGGSQTIYNFTDTEAFRITCYKSGNPSVTDTVVVQWHSDPWPPTVNLDADPTTVSSGGNPTLTWTTVNAASCTASASPANAQWSGSVSASGGNRTISNLTNTTTFTISCLGSNGLPRGDNASVTVTPTNASINVTTNNSGASWTISPGGLTGSGTSGSHTVNPSSSGTVYTISPNSIPNHTVTVSHILNGTPGSGSSVTIFPGDTASFSLNYISTGPAFDYSLSNGGNVSVTKGGGSNNTTVTKTLTQGTTQSVNITATGMPTGVSVGYGNRTCNPTCTSTVTFTASASAPSGTYPITVTGSSAGTPNKTTNFNLIISNPSAPTVTITPTPSGPANPGTPITWTPAVNGGSNCSFTWSGTEVPTTPAPTGNPYTITYPTSGTKTIEVTASCDEGTVLGTNTIPIAPDPEYIEI